MRTWAAVVVFGNLVVIIVSGQALGLQQRTWATLDYPGATTTEPNDIDGSNIVGWCVINNVGHGFLHNDAGWTLLDYPGSTFTLAAGMSGNRITGRYSDGTGDHGFLYDGTTWQTLDYPGALRTYPAAISGNKVVGLYSDQAMALHGFIYDGSNWSTINYGTASYTSPKGISGNTVVGHYVTNTAHGFSYTGGVWTPLQYPGSYFTTVSGIDGSNMVGYWFSTGNTFGFLNDGSTWSVLAYPGAYSETHPNGISGTRIVGYYDTLVNGGIIHHGFISTPEPATLSLLALGGLLIARRRRAMGPLAALILVGLLAGVSRPASADVLNMGGTRNPTTGQWTGLASLETVPIGDAGNTGELSGTGAGGYGADRICGSVGYNYSIGKYEVTAGQYAELLNKVAAADTYGLYNSLMWSDAYACKIQQHGSSGSYTYTVNADWANRPVNFVGFGCMSSATMVV